MYNSLIISVAVNTFLAVTWRGDRLHNAYWTLFCQPPDGLVPCVVTDGPFPNQYMAAADFYKRGPTISHWQAMDGTDPKIGIETAWKEMFGVNFKKAFDSAHPDGVPVEGVMFTTFGK